MRRNTKPALFLCFLLTFPVSLLAEQNTDGESKELFILCLSF